MGTADVVELTSALVAIDSVNPSLEPGAAGEAEVAAHVASWARSAGLEAEVHEQTAGRPSVVVRARGARRREHASALRASRHRRRGGDDRWARAARGR